MFFYFSGNELQKRWKNLRTCFKREYDAQKNVASGSGAQKRRKYLYFEQMLFLRDSIESRITSNSIEQNDNYEKGDVDEHEESQEMTVNTRANPMAKSSTRRKAPISKSYEESLLQILKEKKDEDKEIDEDKYFLLSLLPSFKKFNEDQKFVARTQILNVMRHVRMSGSLTTANLNIGNPMHLDTARRTGGNSTPSQSSCGDGFTSFGQSPTFPTQQDPCYYATHSVQSAAKLFSSFPGEEERVNFFNQPPVDDNDSELSSILTL